MFPTLIASAFFFFHQPGLCIIPEVARQPGVAPVIRHQFVVNGSTRLLAKTTPEGRCMALSAFWVDQYNNYTWRIRCEYPGILPSEWSDVSFKLGLNEGQCV